MAGALCYDNGSSCIELKQSITSAVSNASTDLTQTMRELDIQLSQIKKELLELKTALACCNKNIIRSSNNNNKNN
jgi:hypothetical protein